MTPLRLGFMDTLKEGWLPAMKSFGKGAKKLKREQLDDLVGAFDFEMDSALRGLAGEDDIYDAGRRRNKVQKSVEFLADIQAHATGINYWTQGTRRIAANVASGSMVRKLLKWKKTGKMSKYDAEQFAATGIGKEDYAKIVEQIEKYSEKYGSSHVSNIHLWDKEAVDAVNKFKNAVQVQIEGITLAPGVESLPFFAQNNQWLKMMFQFKSFMNAATGKITLSTLQRRDMGAVTGVTALITAGTLQGMLKDALNGKDVDLSLTPENIGQHITRGISESGFLGLVGTTALDGYRVVNSDWAGRYGADNLSSVVLGPSAGQLHKVIQDGINAGQGTGDIMKSIKELLPFQNLAWYNWALKRVFEQRKEDKKRRKKLIIT